MPRPKPRSPQELLREDCEAFLLLWDEYWNTGAFAGPPWYVLQETAEQIRKRLEKK